MGQVIMTAEVNQTQRPRQRVLAIQSQLQSHMDFAMPQQTHVPHWLRLLSRRCPYQAV